MLYWQPFKTIYTEASRLSFALSFEFEHKMQTLRAYMLKNTKRISFICES